MLAGGFIWAAAFGMTLGLINKYLVTKTEHRAKRHVADLFGGQVRTVWLLVDGIEVETPLPGYGSMIRWSFMPVR